MICGSCLARLKRSPTISRPGQGQNHARLQFSTSGGGLKRAMPHASPASQVGLVRWMIDCGVGRRVGSIGSL